MSQISAQIFVDPKGYEWQIAGVCPDFYRGRLREEAIAARGGDENATCGYLVPIWLSAVPRKALSPMFIAPPQFIDGATTYDPLSTEPALFRIFAELNATEESIQRFANKYGDIAYLSNLAWDWHIDIIGGYSIAGWQSAINAMRDTIARGEVLAAYRKNERGERGERERAARISEFANSLLCGSTHVPVWLSATSKNGISDLRTMTYSLYDAMILQCIEALTENKRYRRCETCGKPFEVTPAFNRSDRIYCSDNCRVKAYQARRKRAKEMRAEGHTLREIAKELECNMETTKKWMEAEIEKRFKNIRITRKED